MGRTQSDERIIPLNVKYSLDDKDPQMQKIAEFLGKGFNLETLVPGSGSIPITQKNMIATFALSRLIADLERATARPSENQTRVGASAAQEEDSPQLPVQTSATKKVPMRDIGNMMASKT